MKNVILILVMMAPLAGFSQWTQQQQDDYRKQMEQLQQQMNDEMQQLRDSLQQLKQTIDWSAFDSINSELQMEMPEMPEMPEAPEPPPTYSQSGETESFPGGEVYTNNRDTTEVRWGKWHVNVHENDNGKDQVQVYKDENCDGCDDHDHGWDNSMHTVETKFLLLDLGVNNYFGPNFNSRLPGYEWFEPNPGKSWVVNIHLVNQRLNLIDHHLWLSYGLYFELNSYKYSNNDQVLVPRIDSVTYAVSDVPLKKNKVSCEYMGIPLMLRYESNPHDLSNSFHVSAGGFGEYLLGARTKTKSNTNDKSKVHDDFNLNPFRYGITARAGYGFVNVFANFGLSKLFKDDVQPTAYPFSAGLAFEF